MASAKQILLASLLGGVSGGTNQYLTEKKNQQEYALKRLEAGKPPSDIQSLKYIEPGFDDLPTNDKRQRYLDAKTAASGTTVRVGPSGDISKTPPPSTTPPSTTDRILSAHEREVRAEHPDWNQSRVTVEAGKRMKAKAQNTGW